MNLRIIKTDNNLCLEIIKILRCYFNIISRSIRRKVIMTAFGSVIGIKFKIKMCYFIMLRCRLQLHVISQ